MEMEMNVEVFELAFWLNSLPDGLKDKSNELNL